MAASIRSFRRAGEVLAFVSRVAWNGTVGDWERTARIAESEGAEVILGDWSEEREHRTFALATLRERGVRHALIPDGDEIVEPRLLDSLLNVAAMDLADRICVQMDTYWKTPEHVIRPRESLEPVLLLNVQAVEHEYIRQYRGGRRLVIDASHGVLHHLSYAGPDERIRRKIETWGHRDEVVPNWYANIWKAWDYNPLMRHLHPTHPAAYGWIERIELPEALRTVGLESAPRPELSRPPSFPSVSVCIPLYGGEEDIRLCLESLERCRDLLHEVIVVDNASPDGAAEIAASHEFVTLIRNAENLGFAKASNQGYEASSGEVVLFLNSDTIVPRVGLLELIASLEGSGAVAAAGPHSNNVFGAQWVEATYTSLGTIDLFAEAFARREVEDRETDMLVGFCLAVRRRVLEELGAFDESFGVGTFEDNDLCYRFRRAGYRLMIASKAYVHHSGSKTIQRLPTHPVALLRKNQNVYETKWREDLETGYASHLAGLRPEPVRFHPDRKPEIRERRLAELRERADISLCMIVKNEERVLGDCLASAKPYFRQIVVVDTGSTDRTREIALEHGAELYEFPWTDSFSEARNESLKYAKGRWLFWMDADDTLPVASGESILQAALQAPPQVHGFVVPVQFVDEGIGAGTRVDHVKLIRNLPDLEFEGRIHEQILPSLRKHGGEIARLDAVVMHSGYDTSDEGQARKRLRDEKLLMLDLQERPDHPFVLFNLGMTAHYTRQHEEAVTWLERCLAVSRPEESHVRKAYALLAVSLRELDLAEESKATLLKGLETVGHDPELHFQAGLLLTNLGEYDEAKSHYLQVQSNIDGHFSSLDIGILGHKRLFNLGSLCLVMGDYDEARKWWLESMEREPGFLHSHFALFDAALEKKDLATAQEVMDRVFLAENAGPSWTQMGMRYAEALGGPQNVEAFLQKAHVEYPQQVAPALMLARRYLETDRELQALPQLMDLERYGNAEAAYLLGVCDLRRGDFSGALRHLEIAHELNPNHELTMRQLQNLKDAIAQDAVPAF